jgi:hypothetical protein
VTETSSGFGWALVGCTSKKRDEAAPARDLYDESPLFRRRSKIAIEHAGRWGILSAEHGFVHPADELAPYDTHISEVDVDAWATEVLANLEPLVGPGDRVIVLAGGQDYVDPIRGPLRDRGVRVASPLRKQPPWTQYSVLDDLYTALEAQAESPAADDHEGGGDRA